MKNTVAEWTGSTQALKDLEIAIARNCVAPCEEGMPRCAAHSMLSDQKMMNRLSFVARNRKFYEDCENDQAEHTMEGTAPSETAPAHDDQ